MAKITSYKHAKKLYFIYAAIGILLMLIAQSPFSTTVKWVLMVLGGLLIIGAFVWVIAFYKCPICQSHLPVSQGLPDYCPTCGKKLE
ncbi:MAG: hypothetical protein GX815_04665 [Clostridiales bacterium]|jgi:hypothetical protein|nr:hypothetical protein [Clostridiales bacterium]